MFREMLQPLFFRTVETTGEREENPLKQSGSENGGRE
jgi:hypothetical protein